ncbi:hypothetical protein [Jidongwangia harbinensis]|uniref:hypothetical protein n=1 Tax=Jidongwangia harbinensis TaxID=2878561 RepID=UPI001CD9DAB1|nr:hypothetical protein [Jidongwangia harbinensis]MCA2214883.1 hypothetical protein [Jidongwangia harbinensis]
MTRNHLALTLSTLGLAGVLGLTGCGAAPDSSGAANLADEAYALQAVGLETGLAATPAPSASAGEDKPGRHPGVRRHLRKNTLHGEIVVQAKDGVRTVVVQRGAVTAVDGSTVSVRSTDGYVITWTLHEKVRVRHAKKKADVADMKAGAQVGVAGAKDGDATVARLVVIQ